MCGFKGQHLYRRWGYDVKGVPKNQAKVLFAENNFWGRTIAAVSSSTGKTHFERWTRCAISQDVLRGITLIKQQ